MKINLDIKSEEEVSNYVRMHIFAAVGAREPGWSRAAALIGGVEGSWRRSVGGGV